MSIRYRRLAELKQTKQMAEFHLSNGTVITGTVQDIDQSDVVILSDSGERIVALSAIVDIRIGATAMNSQPRSVGEYTAPSSTLSSFAERAQNAIREAHWTQMQLPKTVDRLDIQRHLMMDIPGQLWASAMNYMRDRAWQSAGQKFVELGRCLGNRYEPYYNAAICYYHASEFAIATLLFEQSIRLNSNRDALTGGTSAALQAQLWHKAVVWMIELFLMSRGDAATHSAVDYALRLGLYQTTANALQQALLKQVQLDVNWLAERLAYIVQHLSQSSLPFINEVEDFCRTPDLDQASRLISRLLPSLSDQPTLEYRTAQGIVASLLERYPQYNFAKLDSLYTQAEEARQTERLHMAKELFEALSRIDPNNRRVKNALRDLESRLAPPPRLSTLVRRSTPSPKPPASLPGGGGFYQRAKRAELEEKDFAAAEQYFRQAIQRGEDRAESAVKDLASLLNRLNRSDEAIQELENYLRLHRTRVSNEVSFRNQLIDLYQRVGNYKRAIELIDKNLLELPHNRHHIALQRKAYCQMQLDQLKEAQETLQQVLRRVPTNDVAQRWLESVQEALRSGEKLSLVSLETAYNELWDRSISPFLRFHIERCTYEGIPDARRAARDFTEEDFNKLRGLIEGAGQKRPSQRADLYLTQVAVAEQLGKETNEVFNPLYRYALNMAEASAIENKHPDVTGAYISSAVSAAEKMNDLLEKLLNDYLKGLGHIKPGQAGHLPQTLKYIIANKQAAVFEWLLETSLSAQIISESVLRVASDQSLDGKFHELCRSHAPTLEPLSDVKEAWRAARNAIRQKRDRIRNEFDYLRSKAADLNTIEEQRARLAELRSLLRSGLDQERLQSIMEIQEQVYSYTKETSYVERERLAYIVTETAIPNLLREFETNPTVYAIEQFYSYLEELQRTLKEHFERIQQQAEPQDLKCELAVESYPDENEIKCQIVISNAEGKSPISELVVHVAPSPSDEYTLIQQTVLLNATLEGGRSVTCQVPICLTVAARAAQVLTLHYTLSYTLRSGRKVSQADLTLPIRLYSAEDFEPIHNPYAVYANGKQVEDDKMFYGRDTLIKNLRESILNAPSGKSVVIYGQKRTGKSSVLYHLKQQLPEHFITIKFSIGDIANDPSVKTFLYTIIQRLSNELADHLSEFEDAERPSLNALAESPELVFNDYMDGILRKLKRIKPDAQLILLLDEFSYLYSGIQSGMLPRTFMRFWKALLERGYFSAVLVGQDSMPRFIEEFPNEFQVSQPERVTYLAEGDARRLIIEPIQIPETGESRYRGRAVERLLQLTANSPYYIQIFCNRLVEYMNRNKAIYVTDADIERVKQDLLRGQNALNVGQFDNLLSSADEHTNVISVADARAVLSQIAQHTRHQDYCEVSRIQAHTSKPLTEILEDLVRREVLEKQSETYRIRVGLFKEWLLESQ
jgi:tetratricopeptide (TPR) repeat protein